MVKALNETFISAIVYRSDSSIAQEASKFCEEVLKLKILNQTD